MEIYFIVFNQHQTETQKYAYIFYGLLVIIFFLIPSDHLTDEIAQKSNNHRKNLCELCNFTRENNVISSKNSLSCHFGQLQAL